MGCSSEPRRSLFHDITLLFAGCLHPERKAVPFRRGDRKEKNKSVQGHAANCCRTSLVIFTMQMRSSVNSYIAISRLLGLYCEKCLFAEVSVIFQSSGNPGSQQTDFHQQLPCLEGYLTSC